MCVSVCLCGCVAAEALRGGEARVRAVLAGSRSAALLADEPPDWVKEVGHPCVRPCVLRDCVYAEGACVYVLAR